VKPSGRLTYEYISLYPHLSTPALNPSYHPGARPMEQQPLGEWFQRLGGAVRINGGWEQRYRW